MYSFLELLYTWKKFHVDKIFQNPLSILIFFFYFRSTISLQKYESFQEMYTFYPRTLCLKVSGFVGHHASGPQPSNWRLAPLFSLWIVDIQNQCPCYWSKFGLGSLQFVDIWSNPFYWKLVISMQNLGQGHILKMHNLL